MVVLLEFPAKTQLACNLENYLTLKLLFFAVSTASFTGKIFN